MNDKDFLQFLFDRLCIVYGESENYDYMHRFKSIIDKVGTEQSQTFYCIKRDEEPRYWDDGSGWSVKNMSLMTEDGVKASMEWLHENSLADRVKTARIVKVRIEEINE